MLTGSHNPKEYNGLKIVLNQSTPQLTNLLQRIQTQQFSQGQGQLTQHNLCNDYITTIKQSISLQRPLTVVIDCGNGVVGNIAPTLLKTLGCNVIPLYCDINGNFPNHHPDPSQVKNLHPLQEAVITHNADLGLAFDGDGDRLGVITNQGTIIWPDRQMMLFAIDILKDHPNGSILFDVKCSSLLHDLIKSNGGNPIMWKTGHALIKKKLRECHAKLAGEMSGHLFFNDRWFGFDDALYSAAKKITRNYCKTITRY